MEKKIIERVQAITTADDTLTVEKLIALLKPYKDVPGAYIDFFDDFDVITLEVIYEDLETDEEAQRRIEQEEARRKKSDHQRRMAEREAWVTLNAKFIRDRKPGESFSDFMMRTIEEGLKGRVQF